jgi:4-hydroxybenzoate polyprenyltransferase
MIKTNSSNSHPLLQEIWHFIIHLRPHYQIFILSGGFLLGGVVSPTMHWADFGIQFLNVHILLFGGATAYNSYWDKDQGPVGGLQHPPGMQEWMWTVSLLLQAIGFGIALYFKWTYAAVYGVSILFFWLYSTPHARWKGGPVKSLVAIGISTGFNSGLMGFFAAGGQIPDGTILTASLGVMFIMLSLYPVSQLYQMDEDIRRGDQTFAIRFGFVGVIRFFAVAFGGGVMLIASAFLSLYFWGAMVFGLMGFCTGLWLFTKLKNLSAQRDDYYSVMQMKYISSITFVIFLLIILWSRHGHPGAY